MNMNKKPLAVFFAAVLLVIGFVVGLYVGQSQGSERAEQKFSALIDRAYPKPPAVMNSLSGTVKAVRGGIIDLEVIDPDDYLPHTDGTQQKRELRFAKVSSNTELALVDYTSRQPSGGPSVTPIQLSDLKAGDTVRVRSNQNIRDAKEFDVYRVEVIKF